MARAKRRALRQHGKQEESNDMLDRAQRFQIWTHVRKLLGWDRYDSLEAQAAINDLYRNELRLMMNLYQPSVKLVRKTRVGARLHRRYDRPQTPLDRLLASSVGDPAHLRALQRLRHRLDPFALAAAIDRQLQRIYRLDQPPVQSARGLPSGHCAQPAIHPTTAPLEQRLALSPPAGPAQHCRGPGS